METGALAEPEEREPQPCVSQKVAPHPVPGTGEHSCLLTIVGGDLGCDPLWAIWSLKGTVMTLGLTSVGSQPGLTLAQQLCHGLCTVGPAWPRQGLGERAAGESRGEEMGTGEHHGTC